MRLWVPIMTSQPSSRQELYDRIREVGRTQFIYEQMVRLGFWAGPHPNSIASAEHARKQELIAQLNVLRTEQSRLRNTAELLKEARKRRMADSRLRQQETKARRERERERRAQAWAERKQLDLLHLGPGRSGGLNDAALEVDLLARFGLPPLGSPHEIASAMGITLGELRFLAYGRPVSQVSHYVRFKLPKKTGGHRLISAPMPRLKRAQRWIYDNILSRLQVHDAAHGFLPGRSIVSNARPHVGAEVVVNLDLKDFFPTMTYPRVWGVFRSLGYSKAATTVFAMLCTEPESVQIDLDGRRYFVATSERFLPQGAPTSPAITNWACRRLDQRLCDIAALNGFSAYTRYADDLTFSGDKAALPKVGRLLSQARNVIADERFVVHPDKTRVLHRGRRQEVTGLVVNDLPNIPRDTLRRFRALLFQIEKDGPEGKQWGAGGDVINSIEGFANYVLMVNPAKGAAFKAQIARIVARHGRPAPRYAPSAPALGAAPALSPSPTPTHGGPPSNPSPSLPEIPVSPPSSPVAPIEVDVPEGGPEGTQGEDSKKWWKMW